MHVALHCDSIVSELPSKLLVTTCGYTELKATRPTCSSNRYSATSPPVRGDGVVPPPPPTGTQADPVLIQSIGVVPLVLVQFVVLLTTRIWLAFCDEGAGSAETATGALTTTCGVLMQVLFFTGCGASCWPGPHCPRSASAPANTSSKVLISIGPF